jgi:hypothetical protein
MSGLVGLEVHLDSACDCCTKSPSGRLTWAIGRARSLRVVGREKVTG